MPSVEERWREKPPSAFTVWLLTAIAALSLWVGLFVASGVLKTVAVVTLIILVNLAVIAWRARRSRPT